MREKLQILWNGTKRAKTLFQAAMFIFIASLALFLLMIGGAAASGGSVSNAFETTKGFMWFSGLASAYYFIMTFVAKRFGLDNDRAHDDQEPAATKDDLKSAAAQLNRKIPNKK